MAAEHDEAPPPWKPRLSDFRPAARAVLDLLLPPRTLDDNAPAQGAGLSRQGWGRIVFLETPVCDGCGSPFEYDLGAAVRCAACLSHPRAYSRARAACLYDDASRDLILQLKHADRTDLAGLLCAWIGRAAADLIADADAIVPVPLHPWKLFRRRPVADLPAWPPYRTRRRAPGR